jgi:hypothetical protein
MPNAPIKLDGASHRSKARTSALHRLLDENVARWPETPTQLSSHLPMALQALHALGAPAERLDAFHHAFVQRFKPESSPAAAPAADWPRLLGRIDAYPALRAQFTVALAAEGTAAVLRQSLPILLPGAAAAALHGPIRAAHALEAGHSGELACALAYWAARWQPVARPLQRPEDLGFDAWAPRLVEVALQWTPEAPLISQRMQIAETSDAYHALAGRLRPQPDTLRCLIAFAAQRYAATRNFTVLHMVTGLRALRLLLPWAGPIDTAELTRALVHASTAAYLAARTAHWPDLPAPPAVGSAEAVQRALASDDDHVIKIVHACVQSHAQHPDPAFAAAMARAVA